MEFPHQMVEGGGTLKQTADIVFSKMRELFSVKCLSDSLLTYYTWVCVCVCVSHSVVFNSAATWTVAHQAPLSMGFSRQKYLSGQSFPSPGDLPNPGIKPGSPALQADSWLSEPPGVYCMLLYITNNIQYATHNVFYIICDECSCSVTQLCSTLCDPTNCSLPGSSVQGVFQARILEWVAISYSNMMNIFYSMCNTCIHILNMFLNDLKQLMFL